MRFLALATDYDGTIAHDGTVDDATVRALERFRATGRRLILVTGREICDLKRVFPHCSLFDDVVAENGAVLYDTRTDHERLLTHPPPPALPATLHHRGVTPISVGRAIVATWARHEGTVHQVLRDLCLDYRVIKNKGALMLLPSGVDKATGLAALLAERALAAEYVIAVGDAENDCTFLRACGCAAAVRNALACVRDVASLWLRGQHGAGVTELVDLVCNHEPELLAQLLSAPHRVPLHTRRAAV